MILNFWPVVEYGGRHIWNLAGVTFNRASEQLVNLDYFYGFLVAYRTLEFSGLRVSSLQQLLLKYPRYGQIHLKCSL